MCNGVRIEYSVFTVLHFFHSLLCYSLIPKLIKLVGQKYQIVFFIFFIDYIYRWQK